MASVVVLPSGRFRAFARVQGQKEAQVFGRRQDGQIWADKTEGRMRAGTWQKVASNLAVVAPALTVTQAFAKYAESADWLAKGDITRRVELNKQKPVIAALGNKVLSELTREHIDDYMAKRRQTKPQRNTDPNAKLSATQIRLELAALSSMCNFAVDKKLLSMNPTRSVKRPVGARRTGRVDDDLIGAIFNHVAIADDSVAYPFFRLLFTSGCRPGELTHALKSWLRADPPQILVPRTKNEDARSIVLPLGNYKMLRRHLEEQDESCPYLFGTRKLSKANPGWSPYNYATPWKKVAKDLKFKGTGVVPYLARHEAISKLFERTTLSDGQIAGISGHRSSQALWHYKHLRNELQRPTINAMDQHVDDAISRGATGAHPSKKLRVGQKLKPIKRPWVGTVNE